MIHRKFGALIITAVLLVPASYASAQTASVDSLLKLIAELQAQIATLKVQMGATSSSGGAGLNITRTLSVGSKGEDVKSLQTYLKSKGYLSSEPTGYFGSATQAAVRKFQQANDLEPVGTVGPQTRKILNTPSSMGNSSGSPSSTQPTTPSSGGGGGGGGTTVPTTPTTPSTSPTNTTPTTPSTPTTPTTHTPTQTTTPTSNMVVWQDNLQTESNWLNWGPGFFPVVERPVGQVLSGLGTDAAGASLSRVPDPAGGAGYAIRHYIQTAGGRAQYSMANWTNAAFGAQAAAGQVWIEWEVYFPTVPTSVGPGAWLSIMDFHSHGPNAEQWWATDGAIMFASEALGGTAADAGKLRMRDYTNTKFSNISATALPAGRWVKLQVHYNWSTSEVPITVYVDGVQAMQMYAVTKAPVHTQLEFMVKLYGGNVSTGVWSPNPLVYYTRNVKIGNAFITGASSATTPTTPTPTPTSTPTTPPADTTAPTVTITSPTANQVFPNTTTQVPVTVTTNENATCRLKNWDDTYENMWSFNTTGGTSHSGVFPYVLPGNSHSIHVLCRDAAGNTSTMQYVTVSISA